MSLANTPVVQVCYDDANRAKVKATAWYNGAAGVSIGGSNSVLIQANTLFGANVAAPGPWLLDVLQIEGNIDLTQNTEIVQVQFVSAVNQNTDILVVGGPGNAVFMDGYIPNNANTPTGDILVTLTGGKAGDCYTLMITLQKNNLGVVANGVIIANGAGSWSNGFAQT